MSMQPTKACARCYAPLDETKRSVAWLEFHRTGTFYTFPGWVPSEDSQGLFPFCPWCAEEQIRDDTAKRNAWRFDRARGE